MDMSCSNIDAIKISTAAPDTAFDIDSFTGNERLSRPFEYHAQLHSGQALLNANTLLDNPATITLGDPSTKGRYISGIVAAVSQMPSQSTTLWRYSLRIVPKLWFLTQTSDCRFYHSMTVPEIVEAVLGKFSVVFENKLQGTYSTREYTVMYNESYFNFIQRLMEDEGIFYFFTHADGAHTMVLGDDKSVFQPITNAQIELQDQGSHFLGLTSFQRADSTALGKVTVDDYNAEINPVSPGALRGEAPTVLTATGAPQRTHYAWPAVRSTTSDAGTRANWRIQAAEAAAQLYNGSGGSADFIAGFTFTLTNDPIGIETYVIQSVSAPAAAAPARSTCPAPPSPPPSPGGTFPASSRR
jgi:type VI secretion system secreted protein VgrG